MALVIRPVIAEMIDSEPKILEELMLAHSVAIGAAARKVGNPGTVTIPTFVNIHRNFKDGPPALEDWIEQIQTRRKKFGSWS
ncbi:MAG: hypothetical protein ABL897_11485 [Hyphomicrobium sp.]